MKKHIASFSGGKDSAATVILAHEHGDPLDTIIFSEVMFDKEISGELPEHIEFIKNKCVPLFESWGYEVKILHAKLNYMDIFMREPTRGKRVGTGLKTGFPMARKCQINRSVKVQAIKDYLKDMDPDSYIQYIGIAVDEPERLERLRGTNKISLLEKYGHTEQMAFELCKKYELLSPIYEFAPRGRCWFCPNAKYAELRHLRTEHRDLWDRLLRLEERNDLIGNIFNTLNKKSIHDYENMFFWEDNQLTIFDYIKNERRENG